MTEEEAKTKWCPHIRFAHGNAPTGGNMIIKDDYADPSCRASDCMMWVSGASEKAIEQAMFAGCGVPRGGYCGLAK